MFSQNISRFIILFNILLGIGATTLFLTTFDLVRFVVCLIILGAVSLLYMWLVRKPAFSITADDLNKLGALGFFTSGVGIFFALVSGYPLNTFAQWVGVAVSIIAFFMLCMLVATKDEEKKLLASGEKKIAYYTNAAYWGTTVGSIDYIPITKVLITTNRVILGGNYFGFITLRGGLNLYYPSAVKKKLNKGITAFCVDTITLKTDGIYLTTKGKISVSYRLLIPNQETVYKAIKKVF